MMETVAEIDSPAQTACNSPPAGQRSRESPLWDLLAALHPSGARYDRRREQRYPYPQLIHVTPVGEDGHTPAGPAFVVAGKSLSEHGLGFYHPQPLPQRRVIASVENASGQWVGLLVDLSWCRFTKFGWYDSGGVIVEVVDSPLAAQTE
jgi:hypothetical protein